MKIALGTDHGGFHLKPLLIRDLKRSGYKVRDFGTHSAKPCDYPTIGAKVAEAVSRGRVDRGILLCKSGGGMAIVANKFPKVRAVVAQTAALAKHSREHNDANVLVLGAEHATASRAQAILKAWLATPFAGGRHARRVRQIERIEEEVIARRPARRIPRPSLRGGRRPTKQSPGSGQAAQSQGGIASPLRGSQ